MWDFVNTYLTLYKISTFLATQCQGNNCATAFVLIDYIHLPHEEISAAILTSKKLDEIPFLNLPPERKTRSRAEKLREARLFAGMEMTVETLISLDGI